MLLAALVLLVALIVSAGVGQRPRQIRPWLGREAALAMLDTATSTAESLIVLDVRDGERARSFLDQAGASDAERYDGRRLLRYPSGLEAAFVSHYLAIGEDAAVRAAIERPAAGRAPSLLRDHAYEQASAGEPAGRVVDLYASRAGVQRLLTPQRGVVGAISDQIGPLLSRLGPALAAEGVNLQDVLSIFHGESAVAIAPTPSGTPALVVVARTQHPQRAQAALAELGTPLGALFAPGGSGAGQAPMMGERQLAGTTVHQLSLAPGLQFDYAVAHGVVVISTSVDGIGAVLARGRGLAADGAYRSVHPDRSMESTSLLFLDFSQLLSLGEQTGLARSAGDRMLRADLQKVRAIGLHSTSGKTDSTAELFLQIS